MKDLVQRLCDEAPKVGEPENVWCSVHAKDLREAADLIESQAAEIADLKRIRVAVTAERDALRADTALTFMGEPVLPTRWAAVQLERDTRGMCVVSLRVGGGWVPVIRDNGDIISHVCEPSGIASAVNAARAQEQQT